MVKGVCACAYVWAFECRCQWKSRALKPHEAGVRGGCELPDVGVAN